jgi:transcriptional regulator with XRE-family HTH domain
MAIKAHLDPRAAGEGQRTNPRRALRLETSGLVPDVAGQASETNVTIHNISATGLLLETALDLAVGETLAVDLPEAGVVAAAIMWRSDQFYGCAFEQALGPAALAAAQLQSAAPRPPAASPAIRHGEALGLRINRLRREAGLTLADVAAALGVSKPTVWAWEKGKARPLPERLGAIAATLGITPEALQDCSDGTSDAEAVIAECRQRIAEACGTVPQAVRIMIEL